METKVMRMGSWQTSRRSGRTGIVAEVLLAPAPYLAFVHLWQDADTIEVCPVFELDRVLPVGHLDRID